MAREQKEYDASLTRENLRLTYEDRLKQHQRALDLMEELKNTGKNVRSQPTSSSFSKK